MGKLIIVPTPIGNLEDITLRGLRMLKEAEFILAEDTRHSSKLLQHYGINKPLLSFHSHNEHKVLNVTLDKIGNAKTHVALISDAGTPGISDPGFLLVRACVKENIHVECLPGATALIPALVSSGLTTNRFTFIGFLPQKKGRKTAMEEIKKIDNTVVLYESPFRINKLVAELHETLGNEYSIAICRELTKLHEEIFRGTLEEALEYVNSKLIKGEIVVVLEKIN
jgi:16S rRNA (cytidine1402-2'-O)-methyltransferase